MSDSVTAFERILADAAAGQIVAFETIYARYSPRVKAFALTRRVDDADAVTNDVMLRVFQNLSSFEGDERAFVSWLFTIARNRIIDVQRAAARRPQRSSRSEIPDERVTDSAETEALASIGLDRSLDLLDRLTADQRDVIALRMIADLSIEEVGRIVGRPTTAVKALQRRGLARLQREILDEEVS